MSLLRSAPFGIGFGLGVLTLGLVNFYQLSRSHRSGEWKICMDCGLASGFPFTLYQTETIVSSGGYIWSGVFANVTVAVLIGVFLGLVFANVWKVSGRIR